MNMKGFQANLQQYDEDPHFYLTIATELNNVGAALYESENYSTAIELYEHAIMALMKIYPIDEHESPTTVSRRMLIDKIIQGKGILHSDMDTSKISSARNAIASNPLDFYRTCSESTYDQGAQCLQDALTIDLPSSPTNTLTIDEKTTSQKRAVILYNMGLVRHKNGSLDVALKNFETAKSIMTKTSPSQPLALIVVCNNIGKIHFTHSDIDEAMENFKQALLLGQESMNKQGMTETEVKKLNQHVGTILSNTGRTHFVRGQDDEALAKCEESLVARRIAYENKHVDVATTFYNLGLIHFRRGEIKDALMMYQQFLDNVMSMSANDILFSFIDDAAEFAVSINNIGQTYEKLGMLNDAMSCYEQALKFGAAYINENKIFSIILYNVGMIFFRSNAYGRALEVLQHSLYSLRSSLGKDHPEVAAVLYNIGIVQMKAGKSTEALQSFTECLRLRRLVIECDDLHVANTLFQIGSLFQEIGEYKRAIDVFHETVQIEKLLLGSKHLDVSMTLCRIGQVHHLRGDFKKSLKVFHKALSIAQATGDSAASSIVNILSLIGNVHCESGDVRKATAFFAKAKEVSRRSSNDGSGDCSVAPKSINDSKSNKKAVMKN